MSRRVSHQPTANPTPSATGIRIASVVTVAT